jgi:quercetin dioxygenase-like cupin family protein
VGRGPAAPSSRTIEPFFARFAEIHPFKLAPGMTGRPLFSEGAMIDLIELESGAVVALHSHPHEQLGFVSRGE